MGPLTEPAIKAASNEIEILRLFVKKTLGSNPQAFSVPGYKKLIDVHLKDFFFGIFSFQKKCLDQVL